jgi:hypothetical protein
MPERVAVSIEEMFPDPDLIKSSHPGKMNGR